jgi:hypothetical protein
MELTLTLGSLILVVFCYFLFKWLFRLIFIMVIIKVINVVMKGIKEKGAETLKDIKRNMKGDKDNGASNSGT